MKDQKPQSPLKRISLIFLTITALGITSSWISSCSDTTAATSDITTNATAADHANIERRLTSIEAKLDKQGGDITTLVDLTKFMVEEIGLMADRILEMADKIVETEVLIVEVITNQTAAATSTIGKLTKNKINPSDKAEAPVKKFQSTDPNAPFYFNPAATPFAFDTLLKGGAASSVALKTPIDLAVTTAIPPSITIFGNTPLTNYILIASLDATFATSVQREIKVGAPAITPPPGNGPNPVNLTVAWKDIVGLNQLIVPLNNNTPVFVAIKSLDPITGAVSGLSNSVKFTFN